MWLAYNFNCIIKIMDFWRSLAFI